MREKGKKRDFALPSNQESKTPVVPQTQKIQLKEYPESCFHWPHLCTSAKNWLCGIFPLSWKKKNQATQGFSQESIKFTSFLCFTATPNVKISCCRKAARFSMPFPNKCDRTNVPQRKKKKKKNISTASHHTPPISIYF